MKREDFLVDGAFFQHSEKADNKWNKYQLNVYPYTGDTTVIVAYRVFTHNFKRINDDGVHVEFVRGGIRFWHVLGSIYSYSRVYKFNEFELISTPERELSAQGA
jgi:hypothetical protein